MSKPTWHRDLPYREGMRAHRWMRRQFFTAPRPSGVKYLEVQPPTESDYVTGMYSARLDSYDPKAAQRFRLLRVFGEAGFDPGWRFSYDKGEDLNLRDAYWKYRPNYPDLEWWQDHLRVWIRDDGVAHIGGHFEAKPEEHPKPHLDGVGFRRGPAMRRFRELLSGRGVEFEEVTWTDV